MSRSRIGLSALALALLACGPVSEMRAEGGRAPATRPDLISEGVSFVSRLLGLQRDTAAISHVVSLGPREATVRLDLADGTVREVSVRGGSLFLDGAPAGRVPAGGRLETTWRRILARSVAGDTRSLLAAAAAISEAGLTGEDAATAHRLAAAFRNLRALDPLAGTGAAAEAAARAARLAVDSLSRPLTVADVATLDELKVQIEALSDLAPDVAATVRTSPLRIGPVTLPAGQRLAGSLVVFGGNADVFGTVAGDVVALLGDVIYHGEGIIEGNAVSVGGAVVDAGGVVRGEVRTLSAAGAPAAPAPAVSRRSPVDRIAHDAATVVAVFIALAMVGFGTVFFGRRYVEVIADTATHSFGRSFVVGLLGQLLLLPTFAMLVVGLVLTIVGILLLPFAAVAYVLGAALAVLGGYLAVAHAVGEMWTRRRMATGAFVRNPNAYGYVFSGLVGLLGLWAASALFGWAGPVVFLFRLAAVLVSWVAATVGLGAVLLSRAGLRETFAGRYAGEATDEYLWATPPATPAAGRTERP